MKKIILFFLLGGILPIFAQNLISNGDFEALNNFNYNPNTSPNTFFNQYVPNWENGCPLFGSQGTPDIFSIQNTNCLTKVPSNAWANNMPVRTSGTKNYAGMWAGIEALRCGINQPLNANQTYTLKFYATRNQGHYNCGAYVAGPSSNVLQVQVMLKNSTNPCSGGLIILTSQTITIGGWQSITGTFSLTPSQVAQGYDQIEFRTYTNLTGAYFFMDDVTLLGPTPIPNINGPITFCSNDPLTFNGSIAQGTSSISHLWEIQECTSTGTLIGSANYSLWVSGNPSTFTFPSSLNLPCNKYYRVKLAPSNNVPGEWIETTKIIRINCSPTINPIPAQTICSGTSASINVNSTQWPITVQDVTTGVSTIYFSNPISVSPNVTTTYLITTTNKYGCTASTTTKITVIPSPITTISGPSQFCYGDPITFTGTLTSGYSLKHLWQIQQCDQNGNTLTGTNEFTTPWLYSPFPELFTYNSSTNIPSNYLQPGFYRIKLVTLSAETNGCWGVTYKVIQILPTPNVYFQYPSGLDYLCNGDSVSFYVDPASLPITVFEGNFPLATYTSNPIIVSPNTTTTYTFTPDNDQKFNCSAKRTIIVKNCPKPCFNFIEPNNQIILDSYYGPMTVNGFCLPNEVFIDGSCSEYESGFHLRVSEFDLNSWTFIQDLYNNWVSGSGSVPSSINLNNLVSPNTFDPGKIYLVSLSIGPVWTSTPPQFFRVLDDCAKYASDNKENNQLNDINILNIYPNPTSDIVNFIFEKIETGKIEIYSLDGKLVFSKEFNEINQFEASLSNYQDGVYIARISTVENTITKKIIKE